MKGLVETVLQKIGEGLDEFSRQGGSPGNGAHAMPGQNGSQRALPSGDAIDVKGELIERPQDFGKVRLESGRVIDTDLRHEKRDGKGKGYVTRAKLKTGWKVVTPTKDGTYRLRAKGVKPIGEYEFRPEQMKILEILKEGEPTLLPDLRRRLNMSGKPGLVLNAIRPLVTLGLVRTPEPGGGQVRTPEGTDFLKSRQDQSAPRPTPEVAEDTKTAEAKAPVRAKAPAAKKN